MSGAIADALLPPAILAPLALLFLCAGLRRAALLAVALLVVMSLEVVPHLLTGPLVPAPPPPPRTPPGAIVVLGANSPGLLDTSRTVPGIETLARLRTAARLARRTGLPVLVSGMREADGPEPVGLAMARSLLDDFGIQPRWVERDGTNLWQSATAAAAILRDAGVDTILLVAAASELRLDEAVFASAGLSAVPMPVSDTGTRVPDLAAFMPISSAWVDTGQAIRQWAGLFCQALRACADRMRAL